MRVLQALSTVLRININRCVKHMKLSELKKEVESLSYDEIFFLQINQMNAYLPLFERFINTFSDKTKIDENKRAKYLKPLPMILEYMDSWHFQKIKYVKARRNEIESSISFIRNSALDKRVSSLRIAGVARNLASYLRSTMRVCGQEYKPSFEQLSTSFVRATFNLSVVTELFPIDATNIFYIYLEDFKPSRSEIESVDSAQIMFELVSNKYGFSEEVDKINETLKNIWTQRESLRIYEPDESAWCEDWGDVNNSLHYSFQRAFHGG